MSDFLGGDVNAVVSVRIDATKAREALDSLQRDLNRASSNALRAATRGAATAERRVEPVYVGPDKRAIPGRLRKATRASKVFVTGWADGQPLGFKSAAGPFGKTVMLYRRKVAQSAAHAGFADAQANVLARFEAEYAKSIARAGRA